ncbi:MAG: sulfotransferase [Acidobacteria bacterium]|nr:sulfotransferase [Acidobacteriota bacterium]
MLQELCNGHPDMTITFEFGNFLHLGLPLAQYRRRILRRLWRTKHRSVLAPHATRPRDRAASLLFGLRYLRALRHHGNGAVTVESVGRTLHRFFPAVPIVGDKYPGYVFNLDFLSRQPKLRRVIIYRNCLDVASSALLQYRTRWHTKPWSHKFATAGDVARHWLKAIDCMERHADDLFIIRYENLVQAPMEQMKALAEWLAVDPAGFRADKIHATSLNKHQRGLDDQERAEVLRVAGPTIERLGYRLP